MALNTAAVSVNLHTQSYDDYLPFNVNFLSSRFA